MNQRISCRLPVRHSRPLSFRCIIYDLEDPLRRMKHILLPKRKIIEIAVICDHDVVQKIYPHDVKIMTQNLPLFVLNKHRLVVISSALELMLSTKLHFI